MGFAAAAGRSLGSRTLVTSPWAVDLDRGPLALSPPNATDGGRFPHHPAPYALDCCALHCTENKLVHIAQRDPIFRSRSMRSSMAEMSRVTIPIDPGQVVRLKSGGPLMTIIEIYWCCWFSRGQCNSSKFDRHVIERVDPDDVRVAKDLKAASGAD